MDSIATPIAARTWASAARFVAVMARAAASEALDEGQARATKRALASTAWSDAEAIIAACSRRTRTESRTFVVESDTLVLHL